MMNCIETKYGTLLMEQGKMLHRWKKYISKLFADIWGSRPRIQGQEGKLIMEAEVRKRKEKNGRMLPVQTGL